MFTTELDRRFGGQGISAAAFHPGVIGSNFAHDASGLMRTFYSAGWAKRLMRTPEQGCDQLVWLANGKPGKDWKPGGYYEKRRLARSSAQAADVELARSLWEISQQVVADKGFDA